MIGQCRVNRKAAEMPCLGPKSDPPPAYLMAASFRGDIEMSDRNWESDIALLLLALFIFAAIVIIGIDRDLLALAVTGAVAA